MTGRARQRVLTRTVLRRILPILLLAYFLNFVDRGAVAIARVQMEDDLGLSAAAYGLGAGLFFVGYVVFEVPSNLVLYRVGARRWLARIMVTWGIITAAMVFVTGETGFYVLRVLLGVAEAGFYPGMLYLLTLWLGPGDRARAIGYLLAASQLAAVVGPPLGGALLTVEIGDLRGWQTLFLVIGVATVLVGFALLRVLDDGPQDASWLSPEDRELVARAAEGDGSTAAHGWGRAFRDPIILVSGLVYLLAQAVLYGIGFFVPSMVQSFGVSSTVLIGVVAGIPSVGSLIGVLLYPRLHERLGRTVPLIAIAWVAGGVLLALATVDVPVVTIVALGLGNLFVIGLTPVLWTIPLARLRGAGAAAGIALVNSIGLAGGFAGPALMGVAEQASGDPRAGIPVMSGLCVAGLGALAVLATVVRRSAARPAADSVRP